MRITILGQHLPGRQFVSDGVPLRNVHVAVQVGKDPVGLVPGDARAARWDVDVRAVIYGWDVDLRGPAVHGKKGERFFYLTWGDVGADGTFAMFRRAKLMVADIDADLLRATARDDGRLVASLGLADAHGCPRCARACGRRRSTGGRADGRLGVVADVVVGTLDEAPAVRADVIQPAGGVAALGLDRRHSGYFLPFFLPLPPLDLAALFAALSASEHKMA